MQKKTNTEQKTDFLELFTKELLLNSPTKMTRPHISEEEEVPEEKMEASPLVIPKIKVLEEPEVAYESSIKKTSAPHLRPSKKPVLRKGTIKPKRIFRKKKSPAIVNLRKKFTSPIKTKENVPHIPSPVPKLTSDQLIDLGKLTPLITDKEITIIECPGADKFVLVKKAGKVNLTKIKLSEEEISKIINNFSEKARIPLMEGVFKAIVGNFSINAVITEAVGNRFLIYKKTPYSVIEQ